MYKRFTEDPLSAAKGKGRFVEPRLVLAYHENDYSGAYRVLAELVSRIARHGLRVTAAPLTILEHIVSRGDMVYALLLTEGAHYREVKRVVESRGAILLGKIPEGVVERVLENIRIENCMRVCVYTRTLKRVFKRLEGIGKCGGSNPSCCIIVSALPVEPPPACTEVLLNGVVPRVLNQLVDHIIGLTLEHVLREAYGRLGRFA